MKLTGPSYTLILFVGLLTFYTTDGFAQYYSPPSQQPKAKRASQSQAVPDEVTDFDDNDKPKEVEVRDQAYVRSMIQYALKNASRKSVPSIEILGTPTSLGGDSEQKPPAKSKSALAISMSIGFGWDSGSQEWLYSVRTAVQFCKVSVPTKKALEDAQARIDKKVQSENEKMGRESSRITDLQVRREAYKASCEQRNEQARRKAEENHNTMESVYQEDCDMQAYKNFESWMQSSDDGERNERKHRDEDENESLPTARLIICKRSADVGKDPFVNSSDSSSNSQEAAPMGSMYQPISR